MSRVDEIYQTLLTNNTSGSSEIFKQTVAWIREALSEGRTEDQILPALNTLAKTHASMALLRNFAAFLGVNGARREVIDDWLRDYQDHETRACNYFSRQLAGFTNVLAHSYSGLLYESLRGVTKPLNIFCTEARPCLEGKSLAEKLSETHHKVYLITDMAAFAVIPRIEIAVFGCDSITPRGIINKIGTAPLAEIAQRQGRMNYFVGTTEKVLDVWDDNFLMRQGPRDEIYSGNGTMQVENYYFDLTPPACIGGLILETGLSRMY